MGAVGTGPTVGEDGAPRCPWGLEPAEYRRYHDEEWGRPVGDDTSIFEKLCLEGFQSGLSWLTILRKRDAFRRAFCGFDPAAVAAFGDREIERLLGDASIVRHRQKIAATIANARAVLRLGEDGVSLASLVWRHAPVARPAPPTTTADIVASTPESTALASTLRARGFRFIGPTTAYAAMQSLGLVNDHLAGCVARAAAEQARAAFRPPA